MVFGGAPKIERPPFETALVCPIAAGLAVPVRIDGGYLRCIADLSDILRLSISI